MDDDGSDGACDWWWQRERWLSTDIGGDDKVIMFLTCEGIAEDTVECTFSVPLRGREKTIRNRAIVSYVGLENGEGVWKCFKDSGTESCGHIPRARKVLRKWKNTEAEADENKEEDEDGSEMEGDGPQYLNSEHRRAIPNEIGKLIRSSQRTNLSLEESVQRLLKERYRTCHARCRCGHS